MEETNIHLTFRIDPAPSGMRSSGMNHHSQNHRSPPLRGTSHNL